jgi:hypothetical protein
MRLLPMKVLLVERGEPFLLFETPKADAHELPDFMPFFSVDSVVRLPGGGEFPGLSKKYDVLILPCEIFLEMEVSYRVAPVIAYGGGEAAFASFEAGAVDFMRSGWAMPELEARLYRLWQPTIECGELTIALRGVTLSVKGRVAGSLSSSFVLTPNESAMLRTLFASSGKVVPPGALFDGAGRAPALSRALAMRIVRLKAKLAGVHPLLAESLKSVRGEGYSWSP